VLLALKTNWYADGQLDWDACCTQDVDESKFAELCLAEILIAFGVTAGDDLQLKRRIFDARRRVESPRLGHFAVDCGTPNALSALVGPYDPLHATFAARFLP
jgi:hypothetical protein